MVVVVASMVLLTGVYIAVEPVTTDIHRLVVFGPSSNSIDLTTVDHVTCRLTVVYTKSHAATAYARLDNGRGGVNGTRCARYKYFSVPDDFTNDVVLFKQALHRISAGDAARHTLSSHTVFVVYIFVIMIIGICSTMCQYYSRIGLASPSPPVAITTAPLLPPSEVTAIGG